MKLAKNQITLPSACVRELGLAAGRSAGGELQEGDIVWMLRADGRRTGLDYLAGSLRGSTAGRTQEKTHDVGCADVRDELGAAIESAWTEFDEPALSSSRQLTARYERRASTSSADGAVALTLVPDRSRRACSGRAEHHGSRHRAGGAARASRIANGTTRRVEADRGLLLGGRHLRR